MNQEHAFPPAQFPADDSVQVSASSDRSHGGTPRLLALSAADIAHRQAFEAFVIQHADALYRAPLRYCYGQWEEFNQAYFQGQLVVCYLTFATPGSPAALADYQPVSGFGGHSQIRIRPSLLHGNKTILRPGAQFARGREKFIADVLLHECIHQYHYEVTGKTDRGYKGHGMAFRDTCNEIGAKLGLPPVRAAKRRGDDQDLPSCAMWPHCVRPLHYYAGAYLRPAPRAAQTAAQADAQLWEHWETFHTSQAARGAASLAALVAAAQTFARTWPGSAQEAAACYLDTAADHGSLPQLQTLFAAASAFGPSPAEGTDQARACDPRWGL